MTVAVTDDDQRDMTLAEIVEAYAAGIIDAETFIWREGMDDWLTPYEIPAIEMALRQRGLAPRTSTPPEPPEPEPPRPKDQSGAWREPGRWDAGQAPANVSFDDVTVAMEAPKAQALLEAATEPGTSPVTADSDESTVVADSRRFGVGAQDEPNERPAPRPAAGAPAEPQGIPKPKGVSFTRPDVDGTTRPAAVAARRGDRDAEIDLFAQKAAVDEEAPRARMPSASDAPRGRMPSAPDAPRGRMPSAPDAPRARMASTPPEHAAGMTGARNETSVLFTLDQLTRPKAKPAPKAEKIDAEALLAPSPAVQVEEDGPPSVAKIGGGGLFPAAAMAAPDFNAPAVPSAPSHPPPSAGAHAAPAQEPSGGSSTLWIVLGALGVVGAGTASYFFMVRAPEAPSPDTTETPMPAVTAPAAKVEATATAAPAETAGAASGSTPSVAATAAPIPTQAAPAATAMPAETMAPATPPTAPVATAAAPAQPKPTTTAPPAGQPKPPATTTEAPAAAAADGPPFDKEAAAKALGAAAAQAQAECASQEGTHGNGKVTVTFINSGRATNALVSGDFAGSALGGCIARVFRGAKVPAFGGDSVRVTKGVQIP
jgi:hypothetical protein